MGMAYCTIQDIREEGITVEQASDSKLYMLIELATSFIDGVTGQWFEPRPMELRLDGNDSEILLLPVFLISISVKGVRINGQAISDFRIYNRFWPDDRFNPQIYREAGWPFGKQNIIIDGVWGFVEKEGEGHRTPTLITQAAKRLVIRELPALGDVDAQDARQRVRIVQESTDGHQYSLARETRFTDYTGDPEIDEILIRYRLPAAIGSV